MPRKDSEKLANRLQVNLNTKQDSLVENDETFTVFFDPDDSVTDPNDPDRDHVCEITILDDDVPVGVKSEVTSSPASGNTYRAGETIEFSITFNKELAVQGSRYLVLQVGSDGPSGLRGAAYRSGSGTKTLAFDYTVETADLDTDGVTMLGIRTENGVVLGVGGTGTMKATGTDTVVQPTFTGLSNQSGHKVNGQPYPQRLSITSTPSYETDTYGPGETIHISVNFDQNVDAGAGVFAILRLGSVWTQGRAPYASGSGTYTLVFKYKVRPDDMDRDGVTVFLPHGLDIKATGAEIAYQPNPGGTTPVLEDQPGHRVNGAGVEARTLLSEDSSRLRRIGVAVAVQAW